MYRSIVLTLALASVLTLGVAISAGASPPARSAAQTMILFAHPTGGGSIDNPPKGPSVGDAFYETVVLDDVAGHKRGTGQISGQLVGGTAAHGTEQVALTAFLPGGAITAIGGHTTVGRFTLQVLGGTGKYLGVFGSSEHHPRPPRNRT